MPRLVLIFFVLLANVRKLMGEHVNTNWYTVVSWIIAAVMIALPVAMVINQGRKLALIGERHGIEVMNGRDLLGQNRHTVAVGALGPRCHRCSCMDTPAAHRNRADIVPIAFGGASDESQILLQMFAIGGFFEVERPRNLLGHRAILAR